MEYREQPPPAGLGVWVRAQWTLDCGGAPEAVIEHQAVPDGCIELIWRTKGRSFWGGAQPAAFACGLLGAPAQLRFSGDARFTALRLWPWAWTALGLSPAGLDAWAPLPAELGRPEQGIERLAAVPTEEVAGLAAAILDAESVADLAARSGLSHRALQRWFAAHIGVPPRSYLRLLRFQNAFAGVQSDAGTLADHAAGHGYADQAHMARDFRTLAKAPANEVRKIAKGPFV